MRRSEANDGYYCTRKWMALRQRYSTSLLATNGRYMEAKCHSGWHANDDGNIKVGRANKSDGDAVACKEAYQKYGVNSTAATMQINDGGCVFLQVSKYGKAFTIQLVYPYSFCVTINSGRFASSTVTASWNHRLYFKLYNRSWLSF